jgi:hypothetical protein
MNRDIVMYLSISLSCYLIICISVSLSKNYVFVLQATSFILRRPPWKLLLSVALHQNKCGVMYWERSKRMKRQEHGHCDVSKYRSISLSIWLYLYISVYLLSVCLSVSLSNGVCLCPPGHIVQTKMTRSQVADGGTPSSNLMWCN